MNYAWLLLAALWSSLAVGAQPVSDDEVNAVAARLYCPVCENIPLDDCDTPACRQWREEIRHQLGEGLTQQAIIDDFVLRFGERVVGTPRDPTLRTIVLLTPWALGLAALLVATGRIRRWRLRNQALAVEEQDLAHEADYRARIEADLRARR